TSASRAHNVSITDTLPLDIVYLGTDMSGGGSCSVTPGANVVTTAGNRTLTCSWPSVDRGGQQTATVKVRPLVSHTVVGGGSGSLSNSVVVSTSTPEVAGGGANNSANVPARVIAPAFDLLMNKTDDADPVNVG